VIQVTLNGKPFDENSLEGAIVQMLVSHLRESLGSIRHPETGEFPTIVVTGSDMANLKCHVEGSSELLELVQARLAEDGDAREGRQNDESSEEPQQVNGPEMPLVFLSCAYEDAELARRIAEALVASGIDTWWADWCIAAGDSIRQRVDEGIGNCTHFIVLLTPRSIGRPWVNLEIDAGLLRRLGSGTKFIPLRCDLGVDALTPILQTMHSPEVSAQALDVSQLINDIHGLTRKPPLGPPPAAKARAMMNTEYSPAAMAVAKYFVEESKSGQKFDPQIEPEALASALSVSAEDLSDAVFELKGMVTDISGFTLIPEESLFAKFDKYWKPWDPAEDALLVAVSLVNDGDFPDRPAEMAAVLGWDARRLNPALAYLCSRGLVRDVRAMDGTDFLAVRIDKTDATRRFVKSRK
jgi:TIR domain